MELTYHVRTDPGRVRALNEDSVVVRGAAGQGEAARGTLFVVADGMGGHEAGEVASSQAVETIPPAYFGAAGEPAEALRAAIEAANRAIWERARAEDRQGMGTTVVAAAIVDAALYAAHVGDSRMYLIRDGAIRPLTRDHSLVGEQVQAGVLTPEEAARHPHRNVISRAVGTGPEVEVELSAATPLTLRDGDALLLCSDGLTEHVKPDRLLALAVDRAPEAATQALVDAANAAGGSDNISVIVIHLGQPRAGSSAPITRPLVAPGAAGDEARTAPRSLLQRRREAEAGGDSTKPLPAVTEPPAPMAQAAAAAPPRRRSPWALLFTVLLGGVLLGVAALLGWGFLSASRETVVATPTIVNNFVTPTPTRGAQRSATPAGGGAVPLATFTPGATPTATLPSLFSPTPTGPDATPEPQATPSPAVQATASPAVQATASPIAEATATLVAQATASPAAPQRAIVLLLPFDGAVTSDGSVLFQAEISNVQAGDTVQLRMGDDPAALAVARVELVANGRLWEGRLSRPPNGIYGELYWTVVVVSREQSANGSTIVYRPAAPRRLLWNRPPPPPTASG